MVHLILLQMEERYRTPSVYMTQKIHLSFPFVQEGAQPLFFVEEEYQSALSSG
jgi:hypothetical protein